WLVRECGCDQDILQRLFEKFTYCRRTDPLHAPRDGFVSAVQQSTRLYAALTTTSLLSVPGVARPMNWGDVLWQLSCMEAPTLSWADLVAVVCWCRAWSLGLPTSEASASSFPARPTSLVQVSAAKARLDSLLRDRAVRSSDTSARDGLSPRHGQAREREKQPLPSMHAKLPEHLQSGSPLETVSRRLAQASGFALPPRAHRSKHPWLDDSDDDAPSRADRQYVRAPEVPHLSPRHEVMAPKPAAALRLQLPAEAQLPNPTELQKLEGELAKILNMPVQAVRLQGMRPL
ncbi:PIP5K2, partial [Symbiodinium pilosum]